MSNKLRRIAFERSSIHSVNNWILTLIIYPFFRCERQYLKYYINPTSSSFIDFINPLLGKVNFFKVFVL